MNEVLETFEAKLQKSVSRRRSNLQIFCEILLELSKAKNQTLNITHITGRCNISHSIAESLTEILRVKGMIEIIEHHHEIRYRYQAKYRKRLYRLTDRGSFIVQAYHTIVQNLIDDPYVKRELSLGNWP